MPSVLLASASPRRREILASLGVEFEVLATDVEELSEGPPAEIVVENAVRKARAGAEQAPVGALVIGCDTDVVTDGRTLGKANHETAAREHLAALSGRTHEVLSGLAVIDASGERTALERSLVTFRPLDQATIDLYIGSGEWRDRAGAYAIQGLGSILIERLEGDFSNVVGLPVGALIGLAPTLAPKP
ncbi:MAG: nucleoside triphosphate pyrophosphatase [Solirubrobacterales bacterium]